MRAELGWIASHRDDLSKDEIVLLIVGTPDKPNTGLQHHLGHALSAPIWSQINAQMVESELISLHQEVRRKLKELTKRT